MSSITANARTRLLTAAVRLIREHGTALRMEDVAREAGVSRQSVYLHFGSRAGLLVAAAEHLDATGRLGELIERVVSAPNALAALDAFVTLEADYNPDIYPFAREAMAGRYTDPDAKAAWQNRMEARRQGAAHLVNALQREGLLRPKWDADTATDLLWAIASLQVWEQLVIDRGWSRDRYEQHLRIVLRQILVRPTAS